MASECPFWNSISLFWGLREDFGPLIVHFKHLGIEFSTPGSKFGPVAAKFGPPCRVYVSKMRNLALVVYFMSRETSRSRFLIQKVHFGVL